MNGGVGYGDYNGFKATLWFTFIITLSLGTIWVVLVQFLPDKTPLIAYVSGVLLAVALGVSSIFIKNT